jgi:hypothetical protein
MVGLIGLEPQREFKRALCPLSFSSPSPFKERGSGGEVNPYPHFNP